jgi:hypothetical protein
MSEPTAADRLRRRAVALRQLAGRIDRLTALSLYADAGADTWVGPSPTACSESLRARSLALRQAATDLRAEARRFDRIADEMAALDALRRF